MAEAQGVKQKMAEAWRCQEVGLPNTADTWLSFTIRIDYHNRY